jgi:hypothetical protein
MVLFAGSNARRAVKALANRQSSSSGEEPWRAAYGARRRAAGVEEGVIGSKCGSKCDVSRETPVENIDELKSIQRLCTPMMGIRARRGARAARIDPPGYFSL